MVGEQVREPKRPEARWQGPPRVALQAAPPCLHAAAPWLALHWQHAHREQQVLRAHVGGKEGGVGGWVQAQGGGLEAAWEASRQQRPPPPAGGLQGLPKTQHSLHSHPRASAARTALTMPFFGAASGPSGSSALLHTNSRSPLFSASHVTYSCGGGAVMGGVGPAPAAAAHCPPAPAATAVRQAVASLAPTATSCTLAHSPRCPAAHPGPQQAGEARRLAVHYARVAARQAQRLDQLSVVLPGERVDDGLRAVGPGVCHREGGTQVAPTRVHCPVLQH